MNGIDYKDRFPELDQDFIIILHKKIEIMRKYSRMYNPGVFT